jgi:hypothetical protein
LDGERIGESEAMVTVGVPAAMNAFDSNDFWQ